MKPGQFIKLFILFFYTIACAGKNQGKTSNDVDSTIVPKVTATDVFQTGKVIPKVACQADPTQSYALYIPSNRKSENLPVIYFFDPHGDGALPLDKYKALADSLGFIFIGSNNSKNGNDLSTTENIWNVLFDDTQKRLKINGNQIYVCGFSGGAKVATSIALNHNQLKGVIANGAGLPEITNAGDFKFSFTAVAGEGDLNMTDLIAITNDLDKTQTKHRIIFFDGIHEWAPASTMEIAFEGLRMDAMRDKLIPENDVFISKYIDESKKRINAYLKAGNYLKAETGCKFSISVLSDLTDGVTWFKEKESSVLNNSNYQSQSRAKQEVLSQEQSIKTQYEQQFQRGDIKYWTETIANVKFKAKPKTPEGAMYQRLQAYLSLAFYSITNQLIKGNQNSDASYFVNLYKMIDPTNSEAWYLSAILDACDNNAKATEEDLSKAVANGFNDKERFLKQPEFISLGTKINLSSIENKMK